MKTSFSRRRLLALGLGLPASVAAMGKPAPAAAIHHHVFFWLKEPANAQHIAQLMAGLESLRAIPQIRALHIGTPASTEKRPVVDNSFQVSELMFFDSLKDQAAYQTHPLHQAFVEQHSHLWDKVVVYDVQVNA